MRIAAEQQLSFKDPAQKVCESHWRCGRKYHIFFRIKAAMWKYVFLGLSEFPVVGIKCSIWTLNIQLLSLILFNKLIFKNIALPPCQFFDRFILGDLFPIVIQCFCRHHYAVTIEYLNNVHSLWLPMSLPQLSPLFVFPFHPRWSEMTTLL